MSLTEKQAFYLTLIEKAKCNQQSLRQVAEENGVVPARLYAASKTLKAKGALSCNNQSTGSGFVKVPLDAQDMAPQRIEIRTQLGNGQPLWLSINVAQLTIILQQLGA